MHIAVQMKALRKIQKKQAEAAKQLSKAQNGEVLALTRKLGEQVRCSTLARGSPLCISLPLGAFLNNRSPSLRVSPSVCVIYCLFLVFGGRWEGGYLVPCVRLSLRLSCISRSFFLPFSLFLARSAVLFPCV